MIFGNIQNLEEYPFLEEQIKECFTYAREHELVSYEKGSHEIDGPFVCKCCGVYYNNSRREILGGAQTISGSSSYASRDRTD